jgi:hypothetical protein
VDLRLTTGEGQIVWSDWDGAYSPDAGFATFWSPRLRPWRTDDYGLAVGRTLIVLYNARKGDCV